MTSAPWFDCGRVGAGIGVIAADGWIAVVYGPGTNPEAESNARLIIAAPDLLQSAKQVIDWAKRHDRGHEGSELLEVLSELQSAITKAEGKSQ